MIILTSNKQKDYHRCLVEMLELLDTENVTGIAVVALTDKEVLTGYWNMSLNDKLKAENEIRFDTIDSFIQINRDRYFPDEMDCTIDGEDN